MKKQQIKNEGDVKYINKENFLKFLESVKGGKDDVLLSVNSLISHIETRM